MEESISLEETNKIRISLGLKPLTDDGKPADSKDKEAEDNFAKRKQQAQQEKEKSELVSRIEKNKNKRELHRRLIGKTLGDADDDTDNTLKWVKMSKKKEKELARKRQQDLESMDRMFQGDEYTEKDLAGLKVSHDFEELNEGENRILTLKDSRILDNEEDELQNIDLAEKEKDEKNQELKTKRRDYRGFDEGEFDGGDVRKSVLAKYDEDIEGVTRTEFRLGAGPSQTKRTKNLVSDDTTTTVNKSLLSIDYAKNQEISDYLKEGDVGFKKPKTKKKRSTRQVEVDPDLRTSSGATDPSLGEMEIDVKPTIAPPPNLDANFVDDEDLQAALSRSRRLKTRKIKRLTAEEIARKVAQEQLHELAAPNGNDDTLPEQEDNADGLVFDDTSEFVRAISYNPVSVKAEESVERRTPAQPIVIQVNTGRATDGAEMQDADEELEELEDGEMASIKEEEDDTAMLLAIENAIMNADGGRGRSVSEAPAEIGTSREQTYGAGMASTLNILRQAGALAASTDESRERERIQREKDKWLAEHRHRLAQRELDRLRSRGQNKDQATREYDNRTREQHEAREVMENFKNYKPDIDIKYHDEFGRVLTPKEAWKALSHRFHGKGSGHMKTEKRLKRIAEEKKKEAMASGDTPLSMNRAFQIRQERAGQAHMVLSVGNRGAVPQAADYLDGSALSKEKNDKKAKKKAAKAPAPVVDMTGFTSIPVFASNSGTPGSSSSAVISAPPTAKSGSPTPFMMKSSFSRVANESSMSGSASPVTGLERTKVAFGFMNKGTKRKAEDDDVSTHRKR